MDKPGTAGASAAPHSTGGHSPQERLEASAGGRWLVRAFLALTVTAVVVWNFPGSGIRTGVLPVVDRYMNATGLAQNWKVFAPDPTDTTSEFVARIDYADGTSEQWRPPRGSDLMGEYRTYRWAIYADRQHGEVWRSLREPLAHWLARTHGEGGRRVVKVTLIGRRRPTPPPGTDGPPPPWEQSTLFTLNLNSGSRR